MILLVTMLVLTLVGCSSTSNAHDLINKDVSVQGLALGMPEAELFKLLGTVDKENCVYGYECQFVDQKLVIGLDFDQNIRKIRTSNPNDVVFGVKPGATLEEADKAIVTAGFKKIEGTKKYEKEGYLIELLSMKNTLADQISIEIKPVS